MNLPALLIILISLYLPASPPAEIDQFSDAIVASNHGSELWWYTPRIVHQNISGAPSGWRAATLCSPYWGGVVYLNPAIDDVEQPADIMHELVHLHNNCFGSETYTELASWDALAYLGRDDDVIHAITRRLQGYDDNSLPNVIRNDYYVKPIDTITSYNISQKYPYLYETLVDIGIIEIRYGDRQ
jgi:hypothetical protein